MKHTFLSKKMKIFSFLLLLLQDFFSAIKTCKKRRIGPNREEDNRILFYKKDMSILARSGFNYETSKKSFRFIKKRL